MKHDESLQWLWEEVDVFMPSLYLHTNTQGANFVRQILNRTEHAIELATPARLEKNLPPQTIAPFVRMRYGDDSKRFLSEEHARTEFIVPFEFDFMEPSDHRSSENL